MIRFFIVLISIAIFGSCGTDGFKIEYEHPEGFYKEIYYLNKDSVRHGKYLKFYSNEALADSCQYENGKIHGERKMFSEDGHLEIKESYNNGQFEGPYVSYYPNGQIKMTQQYYDSKIQGEVKEYHENGKIKAISQMIDNLENGPFQEFYENGNIHWEGFYQNGDFEQDTLKEYNDSGELIRKLFCEKGICQTVWTPEKGYVKTKEIFSE